MGSARVGSGSEPSHTSRRSAVCRRILVDQREQLSAAIDAGKTDGSMRADVDGPTLIDAIVGAYLAEHARSENVAGDWEER